MGEARARATLAAATDGGATMRSPVNWALLGLVIERPSYGYELAQRFEHVYGDVLPISGMSHIYMALQALKSRSLIEEIPAPAAPQLDLRRQPRPNFQATEQGMRGYREHLAAQMREGHRRSRLFVRQLSVLCSEPDAALELLAAYEQACLEEAAKKPIDSTSGSPLDGHRELVARLTSEENRLATGAKLAWVEYARSEFAALARGGAQR